MDLRIFSRAHTEGMSTPHNHPQGPEGTDRHPSGQGSVWMYDPLTASGQPYGGIYVDNNDQDSDALNNLLITGKPSGY